MPNLRANDQALPADIGQQFSNSEVQLPESFEDESASLQIQALSSLYGAHHPLVLLCHRLMRERSTKLGCNEVICGDDVRWTVASAEGGPSSSSNGGQVIRFDSHLEAIKTDDDLLERAYTNLPFISTQPAANGPIPAEFIPYEGILDFLSRYDSSNSDLSRREGLNMLKHDALWPILPMSTAFSSQTHDLRSGEDRLRTKSDKPANPFDGTFTSTYSIDTSDPSRFQCSMRSSIH